MRINEILTESQQLDEGPLGQKIQKGLGAVGRGIGAVAAVPQGVGRAIKKGYKAGVNAIGGAEDEPAQANTPAVEPAGTAGGTAPATNADPAAPVQQSANPTVRQINKIIPTLRMRDLKSVKKTVDTTIQQKAQGAKNPLAKSFDKAVNKVAH